MAYWTPTSPVGLNTQPISTGAPSSHVKGNGGEVNSAGDGPSKGAMQVLKKSS